MTELLEYGPLGVIVCVLARVLWKRIEKDRERDRRKIRKQERYIRRDIAKGDVGEETLAMLDDTEPEP